MEAQQFELLMEKLDLILEEIKKKTTYDHWIKAGITEIGKNCLCDRGVPCPIHKQEEE